MKKIIVLLILIISFFIFLSVPVFAEPLLPSATETVDTIQNVYSIYEGFNNDFLKRLYYKISVGTDKSVVDSLISDLQDGSKSYMICYTDRHGQNMANAFTYNQSSMYIVFYNKTGVSRQSSSVDNWALIPTPTTNLILDSTNCFYYYFYNAGTIPNSLGYAVPSDSFNLYMPQCLYNYVPSGTIDFLNAYLNSDNATMQQIADNTEQAAQTAEQINDFLNDTSVDSGSYNQSSTTVPDSGSTDLDGAFNTLKNIFTSSQARDILLPLPFVDDSITIPSNLTSSILGNTAIVTIIQLVYNFILASFIVKDVNKYITRLKDGSIIDGTDSNVKADML